MPFVKSNVKGVSSTALNDAKSNADSHFISPPPRQRRLVPANDTPQPPAASASAQSAEPSKRVRKLKMGDQPKNQPKGDYSVGYSRPPVEHQFKAGNPGGPGRPKGNKSQDTLLREELNAKQIVRIGGVERTLAKRQIATSLFVNGAIEKRDHKQLGALMVESRRLFPEAIVDPFAPEKHDPARDQELLTQLRDMISFGEANPAASDPFADFADGSVRAMDDTGGGAWNEGEWSRNASSLGDDE